MESSSLPLPPHLSTEINAEAHQKCIDEIIKSGQVCTFGSGELSHTLRMRSVYAPKLDRRESNDNVATTKQASWTCVDYIFYGSVVLRCISVRIGLLRYKYVRFNLTEMNY